MGFDTIAGLAIFCAIALFATMKLKFFAFTEEDYIYSFYRNNIDRNRGHFKKWRKNRIMIYSMIFIGSLGGIIYLLR